MKEFVDKIVTLDNIRQWEERDSIIKESVSQHSFKVSAICVFLLENINDWPFIDNEFLKFKIKCVEYSILHDFDESILGRDISHVVKYNDFNGSKIREILTEFVEYKLETMKLKTLFDKFNDKGVKTFCKLCDWIGLYTFIMRNEIMGVKTFDLEKKYCLENITIKRIECEEILKNRFAIHFSFENLVNDLIK
jgi:5'-deoxynucleotidase YfbR-like HD superfamily hydrolase